jgi:peptide/nickel transport system substrate-binding protein
LTLAAATSVVVAVGLMSACSPSKPAKPGGTEAGGQTITIATTTDVLSFNPLLGVSFSDNWISGLMYPTLLTMDENGVKGANAATKWGYTSPTQGFYELRSDMKWSDGTPLSADDVAWELNAIARDKPPGIVSGFMANFQEAKAASPTRVEITLKKPDSVFIAEVGFWMRVLPSHQWSKVGNVGKFANSSDWVSAGPYKLTKAQKGQSYTLERVTPYPFAPNNTPKAEKIVFRVYPDVNTEILALKNGDVDIIGNTLPPSQVEPLKKAQGIEVAAIPGLGYTYMTYNVKQKNTSNVLVRRALAHAVDNETIRKVVLQGQGISTNSQTIAPVLKEWVDPQAKEYTFDPALSKKLMTEAGYKPDSSGKFPPKFRLAYSLVDPVVSQMVTLIRDQAAQAGINIVLEGTDRNTFLQKGVSGDFDIYAGSFSIQDNPISGMQLAFQPGAANNYTFVNDPELLALLDKAQTTTDPAEQVELVHQAARMATDKVYDNVLFLQNLFVAHRKGMTGFQVKPSQLLSIVNPQSLANAQLPG